MEAFGTGHATTSMVASTQMGLILATGPIASYLVEKFDCRKIVITGSLLASCGLIISSFATRFVFLYVTAGIVTGIFVINFGIVIHFRFW